MAILLISLGYAGLYECVKYMTGKSHTDPSATGFALSVMQHLMMLVKSGERKQILTLVYMVHQ